MNNRRIKLWLAFTAVYVIWGSTYLAIRFAIQTIPPFLMAGMRFFVAGVLLLAFSVVFDKERPKLVHWRTAALLGFFLLLCGNAMVSWAETRVPSGLTALLIAAEPLWIVLLTWARPKGKPPTRLQVISLVVGFTGVAFLVAPWEALSGRASIDLLGAAVIVTSTISWAFGSLYGIGAPAPQSKTLANGMTMLVGSLMMLLLSGVKGEWADFHLGRISWVSATAFLYLTIMGSLVAFSAYTYLLTATTPAKASTYAFVNPVIAVLAGFLIGGEAIGMRAVIAMAGIVGAVVLMTVTQASGIKDAAPRSSHVGRKLSPSSS